ncbi:MAG TPA: response regulator [Candidatus Thermoplasmatota archaeon]|nr:response regulator [Candidatus Thermoplasmatota archaeon]
MTDPAPPTKRVLVVDDVPEIGSIFRQTLRRIRGPRLEVVTEVSSQRAKALVQTSRFDLIVSDFRMRDVNGIQLLTAAREHHPDGYRILMSGYHDVPATPDEIEEARVDAYLSKPIQSQDLLLVLISFLNDDKATIGEQRAIARELESLERASPAAPAPERR